MRVDVLYFDGCPHYEAACALIERVSSELGIAPEIRMVEVPDVEAAERLRFLGSPTIRIGGKDIEPSADKRDELVLACRVYKLDSGYSGLPDERWLYDALSSSPCP